VYLSRHCVKSNLVSAVAKGEDDIIMVYDASKCGLNDVIWSPTFGLPTVNTLFRALNKDSFMGDIALGK
jgi:hypothetical protein